MPTRISTIKPKLDHFEPWEFREWYDDMSPGTLRALDHFRKLWGKKVTVSPHPAGLGRHLGPKDTSQHNIDRWGEVRAVDFFPQGLTKQNALFAKECAQKAGFSGIGIYLDTQPGPMMHGDTRPDRSAFHPATWARIKVGEVSTYVGINEAIA